MCQLSLYSSFNGLLQLYGGHDSVSCSDDDSLPPLEEALQNAKLRGNVQDSLQHLNDSVFDPSGTSQTPMQMENSNGESQGTRGMYNGTCLLAE